MRSRVADGEQPAPGDGSERGRVDDFVDQPGLEPLGHDHALSVGAERPAAGRHLRALLRRGASHGEAGRPFGRRVGTVRDQRLFGGGIQRPVREQLLGAGRGGLEAHQHLAGLDVGHGRRQPQQPGAPVHVPLPAAEDDGPAPLQQEAVPGVDVVGDRGRRRAGGDAERQEPVAAPVDHDHEEPAGGATRLEETEVGLEAHAAVSVARRGLQVDDSGIAGCFGLDGKAEHAVETLVAVGKRTPTLDVDALHGHGRTIPASLAPHGRAA